MAGIGKLVASSVHGSQEATIALANLNFDFSLIKLEAPAEFKGVGTALSPLRKQAAEHGSSHVTARKLGVLFEQVLPSTPKLLESYGKRASEIADDPSLVSSFTRLDRVFEEHAGVDGTSIWAAATSGNGAIAVHLLACMLARMWSGPQATSIWVELVDERKKELARSDPSEPLHISTVSAAEIVLSREQLAEWDNSARSWLRTADDVMKLKQKQLVLIIRNVNMPVGNGGSTHRSVLAAWVNALSLMEKVLCGTAQSVQDGASLLGLSCWHLYPNLNVFGNQIIRQNDPFVPASGIVTIGVESSPAQQETGPYWSLPLAHFRHYGPAEVMERSLCIDSERLSLDEFLQVALGSFLSTWDKAYDKVIEYAELIVTFAKFLRTPSRDSCEADIAIDEQLDWLNDNLFSMLEGSAQLLIRSQGAEREMYLRLVRMGHRRAIALLDQSDSMFGLSQHDRLLFALKSTKARVAYFRRVASGLVEELGLKSDKVCIVYRIRDDRYTSFEEAESVNRRTGDSPPIEDGFVYATAIPLPDGPSKRTVTGELKSNLAHQRWAYVNEASQLGTIHQHFENVLPGQKVDGNSERCSIDKNAHLNPVNLPDLDSDGEDDNEGLFDAFTTEEEAQKEQEMLSTFGNRAPYATWLFKLFLGFPGYCAMYVAPEVLDRSKLRTSAIRSAVAVDDLRWAMSARLLSRETLLGYLKDLESATGVLQPNKRHRSLSSLRSVVKTYSQLPHCTIALKAAYRPLTSLRWHQSRHRFGNEAQPDINREQMFALLVTMETGEINPEPDHFKPVMAMASGDFIYVSGPLISDPSRPTNESAGTIHGVRGNLGKPGIGLLVPPAKPMVKEPKEMNWRVINHVRFDGQLIDSFSETSLHLSLTNFCLPVDTGNRGNQDAELLFLEAAVSVHDKGVWIADLKLPEVLDSCEHLASNKDHACGHKTEESKAPLDAIAVDSWSEFLDPPTTSIVLRAHGNWLARLSAASIGLQLGGRRILVVPDDEPLCWRCVEVTVGSQEIRSRVPCTIIC